MSRKLTPQYADPKGVISNSFTPNMGLIAQFAGTPTASLSGFEKGALAFDTTNGLLYYNTGTTSSATWTQLNSGVDLALLTASATELNYLDQDLAANVLTRGTGVDGSEGYHASIARVGGIIVTNIYANIDDLVGSATDLDIIGESATANCHWGQITTAKSGTIFGGTVTCLEVPTGGTADIDFYSSNVATGTQDVIITDAALGTETALVTSGGAWTAAAPMKSMTGLPTANDYIYIVNGAASGGTFTAGKFLITLYGLAA